MDAVPREAVGARLGLEHPETAGTLLCLVCRPFPFVPRVDFLNEISLSDLAFV